MNRLVRYANPKCRFTSTSGNKVQYTEGKIIAYPFTGNKDPDLVNRVHCKTPRWKLDGEDQEKATLAFSLNGQQFVGGVELLLEKPWLLVSDLLVLKLPVVLDTLHGLVDVLLREELPEVLELLLDLLLSCIAKLWNCVWAHLVARSQAPVAKGRSPWLLTCLKCIKFCCHQFLVRSFLELLPKFSTTASTSRSILLVWSHTV